MINQSTTGKTLQALQSKMQAKHLRELFTAQPNRYRNYSLNAAGLTLDFSKNLIDDEILKNLIQLAEEADLSKKIMQLLDGECINFTENKAAWHTALREQKSILPEVADSFQKMVALADQVQNQPIKYVVNLGIGGSDLGPALMIDALRPYQVNNYKFYFVSNVDPSALDDVLAIIKPQETLFIIASKSFTTQETLANANTAKKWLLAHEIDFTQHMIAVTAKPEIAEQFGIIPTQILQFAEWIGGRYSVWSAVGFPVLLSIGLENFKKLLLGAYEMDQHFLNTPLRENMPVIMGLLVVWYNNFWQAETQAIIPYDQHLKLLPEYLQQLIMESNGKSARLDGTLSQEATSPIIWGEVGTNGQHAFYQLLHQGTHLIPIDFILPINGHNADLEQQKLLVANCIAQSEALMVGKKSENLHKYYEGNRPSNTILMTQLTPQHLGALIALYEHATFVESIIWRINAFDQWGVELGKELTKNILLSMSNPDDLLTHDSSTQAQIKFFQACALKR